MQVNITFLIIAILIVAIWVIFILKRVQHKFITLFLIALLLFSFVSFTMVFRGKDISIKSASDVGKLAGAYFSWLGHAFSNLKVITSQVIKMDWETNKTVKLT
ncbi:hypothetical protein M0R19_01165 [Candidatus Pacearchaeota archaeon]|jgi:predicted tellurium resistance membrane protein TerC|nr:hypothetical protein [Candidatus Pacearchaeota archaeon]